MHTPGIVPLILPAHILAGGLALVFGYVALYKTKGATLHRKSGMLFVYTMVTMSPSVALIEGKTWTTRCSSAMSWWCTTARRWPRCGCSARAPTQNSSSVGSPDARASFG